MEGTFYGLILFGPYALVVTMRATSNGLVGLVWTCRFSGLKRGKTFIQIHQSV
jgi:hypothetical protein